jgi:predicted Zn-dependent protease
VNAFALPGGYVYVTRGLLALANDTSEVAAVIAHEMAHVTTRHAFSRAERAEAAAVASRVVQNVVDDRTNIIHIRARFIQSSIS